MSKVRIYGDTSGYVDIAVPAVAGTTTLNLDKIPQADINGNIAMDTDTLYVDAANNRVGIGTASPGADFHINLGTDKNIQYSGVIGEIGSVPGFQSTNDASSGLRSLGMRGTSLRFATGSAERLRITDEVVGIGTDSPSTTDSGYNYGALHLHNQSGSGSQLRWTNSTTGTGTSAGFMISKWSDSKTYLTNFDDGADTVFTQSNSSGTLVTTMTLDGDGDVGIGTTPYANARLTIGGSEVGGYPAVLQFDNANTSGAEFFMLATDTNWTAGANKFIMGHGAPSSSNTDLTIDSSGKVGIGTYTPSYKLDVGHSAAGSIQARLKSSGDTGYTQGAMIIESSDSTSNPGNRGQGVYYYNVPNARTWYAGTLYNNGNKFGFGYKNTAGLQTDAADTGNARMIIDGDAGNVFYNEIGNRGDLTFPICSISNNGSGGNYLHAQFQGYGGAMFHIHYFGYDYTATIRQGSAGGYVYNTGGQSGAYAAAISGHTAVVYQTTTNKIEVVINTGSSNAGNRWGSMVFFGGTDTITGNNPLALVQYAWDNSTSRYWSS